MIFDQSLLLSTIILNDDVCSQHSSKASQTLTLSQGCDKVSCDKVVTVSKQGCHNVVIILRQDCHYVATKFQTTTLIYM